MIERRSPVLSAGIAINSWSWNAAAERTILLIHGGRDQARSWDPYVGRMGPSFHFVAADLRGHGDSGWSPEGNYSIADYVADMGEVLLSLPGTVSIVAHSLGGNIALRLAAMFPEKIDAVAAIECIELPEVRAAATSSVAERARSWFDQRKSFEGKAPPVYPDIPSVAERLARQYPYLDQPLIDHLARFSVRKVEGGLSWKFDHRTRSRPPLDSDGRDFDAMLGSVHCPSMLFYGDQSFVPLPQAWRLGLLRPVGLKRYPDAGHWLHHQQPGRFHADTLAFLTDWSAALA